MAFNNYFPTYPQLYPQQQNYPQQYQQQNNSAIIWVSGEAGAKSYMVVPNQTVVLFDSEQNAIYLKSADASGMPSIKVLDYTIRDNAVQKPEIQPTTDFATKDDVIALHNEIEAIKAKFSESHPQTEKKSRNKEDAEK